MAVIATAVDLRSQFGPVRDQGARPTCLAFAASDAHSAARGELSLLSSEFVFFHAQRRAKRLPTQGAILSAMLDTLRSDGQPEEAGWPYLAADPDPANWSPPADVGAKFKRNGKPHPPSVDQIVADLSAGLPIIVLTKLSKSFFKPSDEGVVDPVTGELPNPSIRHAVVAVGHGSINGKRAILVRNSWGSGWGIGGHAWLTEAFLIPSLMNTAKLLEEV